MSINNFDLVLKQLGFFETYNKLSKEDKAKVDEFKETFLKNNDALFKYSVNAYSSNNNFVQNINDNSSNSEENK